MRSRRASAVRYSRSKLVVGSVRIQKSQSTRPVLNSKLMAVARAVYYIAAAVNPTQTDFQKVTRGFLAC